jgi:hypothetical protein
MSVRHEVHAWNKITIIYEGSAVGLSPKVRIRRLSDNRYLKNDESGWQVAADDSDMVQMSLADMPKIYSYEIPVNRLDLDAEGYVCLIDDAGDGAPYDETLFITVKKFEADQILGDLLGDEDYTDTVAQVLKKLLCVAGGQWEIDADANQLILYDMADPPAALYTFDLKDADDNATSTAPYKREPA